MSCIFFRAVSDPKQQFTAGVLGYCAGYSEEKLRVPSVEEYRVYCVSENQKGCCVYDYRARIDAPVKEASRAPRYRTETIK